MEENIEELKKFIEKDMLIKKKLIDIAPKDSDEYDENAKVDYFDKLFRELKNMETEFLAISNLFSTNAEFASLKKVIESKLKQIKKKIMDNCYSFKELKQIYSKFFSSMSPKLLKEAREACIGYYVWRDTQVVEVLQNVQTINELLHVIHLYIFNNERILQSMPIVDSKENERDQYVLYGEENEVSKQIYEKINPESTKLGTTDIISLSDKVLMMVRDRGHALTLEIDIDKDKVFVKYFIPKICNVELVNKLKGVNKVNYNDTTAYGIFECPKDNIGEDILDFIEQVPTDLDIPFIQDEIVSTYSDISISQAKDKTDIVDEPQTEEQTEREFELVSKNEETWINWLREIAYKTENLPKKLKMQFLIAKKNILELFSKIVGQSSNDDKKIPNDKNER